MNRGVFEITIKDYSNRYDHRYGRSLSGSNRLIIHLHLSVLKLFLIEMNHATNTREFLIQCNHTGPPDRATRHTLFALNLWRPRWMRHHLSSTNQIRPRPLSSRVKTSPKNSLANEIKIGWLNVRLLTNKSIAIRELIDERCYNIFTASETWHHQMDDICLKLACGTNYAVIDKVRTDRRGG